MLKILRTQRYNTPLFHHQLSRSLYTENNNKFFMLNYEFDKNYLQDTQIDSLTEQRNALIKFHEERNAILLAAKKTDKNSGFVLFEDINETVAYDFLKQVFFYQIKKIVGSFLYKWIGHSLGYQGNRNFIHKRV